MSILVAYAWPGNVRELQSAIERAVTLADGPELGAEAFRHLVDEARDAGRRRAGSAARPSPGLVPLEQVERQYILEVLQATRWNRREASRILGISTVTLWRKVGARADESKTT
jgi:two-component system response regulator HydG